MALDSPQLNLEYDYVGCSDGNSRPWLESGHFERIEQFVREQLPRIYSISCSEPVSKENSDKAWDLTTGEKREHRPPYNFPEPGFYIMLYDYMGGPFGDLIHSEQPVFWREIVVSESFDSEQHDRENEHRDREKRWKIWLPHQFRNSKPTESFRWRVDYDHTFRVLKFLGIHSQPINPPDGFVHWDYRRPEQRWDEAARRWRGVLRTHKKGFLGMYRYGDKEVLY